VHVVTAHAQLAAALPVHTTFSVQVLEALKATDDCGAEFADAVADVVLPYETQWVDWKNSGCPPFDRPAAPPVMAVSQRGAPHSTVATATVAQQLLLSDVAIAGAASPALLTGMPPPAKRRRAGDVGQGSAAKTSTLTVASTLLRQLELPSDQMAGLLAADRLVQGGGHLLPSLEVWRKLFTGLKWLHWLYIWHRIIPPMLFRCMRMLFAVWSAKVDWFLLLVGH
jgi:hypothetical protein